MADIIIMSSSATKKQIDNVVKRIEDLGFKVNLSEGAEKTIIGLIGDTRGISDEVFKILPGVGEVISILKDYKLASREFHPADTVIKVGDVTIGGYTTVVIAGPCSVESEKQLLKSAEFIKKSGGKILRGGAFKPRTSPYAFSGLGVEGLRILKNIKEKTGLPIITEVLSPEDVDGTKEVADILQIGARNMFNYRLLQKVGKINKPVMLKRAFSATIIEFLNCAEYILKEGNKKVILCERGIRSFDSTFTRNTLDLSAVAVLKRETHLPVFVDPSHGTGKRDLVIPMSKASIAAGANGLMIEVHPSPEKALSDGYQSLTLEMFAQLMKEVAPIAKIMGSKI
ncbi:MAG: 3-deoxy-7-phosphoheptulonate synthase [Candidatus Ratteibacteria bacterium]